MQYSVLCYTVPILSPMLTTKLIVEFLRQITCHTHIHKHIVQRYHYIAENMVFYHCCKMYINGHAYRMPVEANRNYTDDCKQLSACPSIITARQPCCVTGC